MLCLLLPFRNIGSPLLQGAKPEMSSGDLARGPKAVIDHFENDFHFQNGSLYAFFPHSCPDSVARFR